MTLSRKSALFAGSDGGTCHWANALTLIQSAKLNGVDPMAYLADVLERIPSGKTARCGGTPPGTIRSSSSSRVAASLAGVTAIPNMPTYSSRPRAWKKPLPLIRTMSIIPSSPTGPGAVHHSGTDPNPPTKVVAPLTWIVQSAGPSSSGAFK
jgi:hypothetical protein